MDIGEVVRRTGLKPSAIRYYEERGLIRSTERIGLRRQFDDSVVDRIALILLGKAAGFRLTEIKTLVGSSGTQIDRAALTQKADELDRKIGELRAMRDGLRHAAVCPADSHLECETFNRFLEAARKGQLRPAAPFPSRESAS